MKSKFKRKSPQAVNNAVYHKARIYIPIMTRKLELESKKRARESESTYLEIASRPSPLVEYYKEVELRDNNSYINSKYLATALTLVVASSVLVIGVISNAP